MDKNTQQIIDRARAVCASWEQVKASTGFDDKEKALEFLDAGLDRLIVAVDEYDKGRTDELNHGRVASYFVTTTNDCIEFVGKHRKDLESDNWHYYQKLDGHLVHFRKQHMVAVEEMPVNDQDA